MRARQTYSGLPLPASRVRKEELKNIERIRVASLQYFIRPVHPDYQGRGIGKRRYQARRALTERLGLLRIRAGARLCDYHRVADRISAPASRTRHHQCANASAV